MGNEKLDELKLDTVAFKVLCYLTFREAALKPAEIAKGIGVNPSTVRARLAELKNAGLVESKPNGYVSALNPYDILMKFYRNIKKGTGG
ncbi:MAG: winged helix-turn-helix transcriptional regulator [Candidatus Bathyarchaeota archaeon]|nr:MAG: winged helix-turn-helix transcriptional regulator [Candidatus Bathyarchaeota archaeon]